MNKFTFFVEGSTDEQFLDSILKRIKISSKKTHDYDIKKLDGVNNFGAIDTHIKIIHKNENVIIILDTDEDKDTRINQVKSCIEQNSYDIETLELKKKNTFTNESGHELNVWLWLFPDNKNKGSYETLLWDSITEDDINKTYKEYTTQHADNINKLRTDKLKDKKLNNNQYHKLCLSVFLHSHHRNKKGDYNPYALLAKDKFYGDIIKPLKDYENFIKDIISIHK